MMRRFSILSFPYAFGALALMVLPAFQLNAKSPSTWQEQEPTSEIQAQNNERPASNKGTRILRDPDISHGKIVFAHADDLWVVDQQGGNATRLTSDLGSESDPSFSPDGKWIAFTAQYSGNTDVYIVSSAGGNPKRLTWHPDRDVVQNWTSDNRIMFQSSRDGQPTRSTKFYTVSPEGDFPEPLALPQAYQGEMSPDGKFIAYQENRLWDPEWRNYRGGQAKPIQIVSTKTWDLITTPWEGERHLNPVWLDDVVYYISERDYAANVWSFNPKTKEHRQMTHHVDFDVKSIGAGDGHIVYEQGGYLFLLDTITAESRQISISVASDLNYSRPRFEEVNAASLSEARLSPTGKRALFQTRGDLFTLPLDKGSWRNLTSSSGVADRHPVWSPDGNQIAWFNDEDGEYALVIADQFGSNKRRIEIPDPSFFFVPAWSPDGKKIAFTDTDYRLLYIELESGKLKHVDTDRYAHPNRSMNPIWSPDSRWLAYSRRLDNQLRSIMVHDTQAGTNHSITDGMADSISPVWDASGKYLYFLSSTNFGLNTGWLDMTSYDRPVTRALYVAILNSETDSPFLPVSDEEEVKKNNDDEKDQDSIKNHNKEQKDASPTVPADKSDAAGSKADENKQPTDSDEKSDAENKTEADKDKGKDKDKDKKTPKPVVIDFEKLNLRIVDVPGLPERDYQDLLAGPEGHVFVLQSEENSRGLNVKRYSLKDQKAEDFAEGVSDITISHDLKKVLYRSGNSWLQVDATGSSKAAKPLSVSGVRIKIDPRSEWKQMLREGWRYMRDFLYVENVHGADWEKVWQDYSPWLEGIDHRSDFNYLLDIVSGEVAVGHSYVVGGDMPDLDDPRVGLLGVDLELANDRYRITKIFTGGDWTPGLIGPLAHPGMKVQAGDFLLSINGQELTADINPFQLLEDTAGRTISIEIGQQPDRQDSRKIYVTPIGSERQLRTWDWVEQNQRKVDELSGGRLAYVWLPNTGQGGYTYFNRMYFAQQDRKGAVIDERNNGGGSAADYIIEVLSRELTGYFNSRAGDKRPFTQPMAGLFGPKVMIINESAGSGGDLLPYLFRFKKLGTLVGTKTWGGLVGTWDTPPLIDGGRFVAPRGGFYDVEGKWAVEGEGIAPDIEVFNDPKSVIQGHDPQLERAVAEALKKLETEAVELKPEPAPPIRARRPEVKTEN